MAESEKKKPRLSDLPHPRADCPAKAFYHSVHNESHSRNLKTCESCYCLICDCLVSECSVWDIHCMGYYTHPDWRAIRKQPTAQIASFLLPPCVLRNPNNAERIKQTSFVYKCRDMHKSLIIRDVIDLEAGADEEHSEGPKPVTCIDLLSENEVPMTETVEVVSIRLNADKTLLQNQTKLLTREENVRTENNACATSNVLSTHEKVCTFQIPPVTDQQHAEERAQPESFRIDLLPSVKELTTLRQLWQVSKINPAPHLFVPQCKKNHTVQSLKGSKSSSCLLIGYIDMWRPYCSHMTASKIEFSCPQHAHDIASLLSPKDMRVSGMKGSHISILATEMGLDLRLTALLEDCDDHLFEDGLIGLRSFVDVSSVAWEDGTPMPTLIREELYSCIKKKLIKVRWDLSHFPGADLENKKKAFAYCHSIFKSYDSETRVQLYKEQLEWLSSFCSTNSIYAYMEPIDGGQSLASTLSGNDDVFLERRNNLQSYLNPTSLKEDMRTFGENGLHSCRSENIKASLVAVMSALRCEGDNYVRAITTSGDRTQRFASVLEASVTHLSPTFKTLCPTNHSGSERTKKYQHEQFVKTLCKLSHKDNSETTGNASITAVLSSPSFTVSKGYVRTEELPLGLKLRLLTYQKETLGWMLDQEKKRSISDPFWVCIHGVNENQEKRTVYYCPLSGCFSKVLPPPVVGGVLAEEMGLGKTILAISLILITLEDARSCIQAVDGFRSDLIPSHCTLIICSTSLLDQWQEEIERRLKVLCWYNKRVYDPKEISKYDIVLTTYGVLSRGCSNALRLVAWHRIFLDECTELSSCRNDVQKMRSELKLVSRRRWAISGTPFGDNFRQNFLPILRFLGVVPFSNRNSFEDVAGTMTKSLNDPFLAKSHSIPRFMYLMKNVMMRHVKGQELYGQPLIQLLPAFGHCVWVSFDSNEMKRYEAFERHAKHRTRRALCSMLGSQILELSALIRQLRMKADGVTPKPRAKDEPNFEGEGSDDDYEAPHNGAQKTACAKVKQLVRDVRSHTCQDVTSKIVVYTEFNQVRKRIKRALQHVGISALTIDGSLDAHQRGRVVKTFEEDLDATVLVLTLNANKCGLNLTMANIVVLFEIGLSLAAELQAVNRVHRIGQTRPIKMLTYVSRGTIDERIVKVRERKGQPRVVGLEREGNGEIMSTLETYRFLLSVDKKDS